MHCMRCLERFKEALGERMYAKIHSVQGKSVLAACDKELLGKELRHGKIQVMINPGFYKEKLVSEEELMDLLDGAESINLFGEKCVGIAVKKGLVSMDSVILIDKVPHAQIFLI